MLVIKIELTKEEHAQMKINAIASSKSVQKLYAEIIRAWLKKNNTYKP